MIWCSLKPLKIARAILSFLCCALAHSVLRWLELRRLPPIMGFVGSAPGLVTLLA